MGDSQVHALAGVSVTVERGEFIAIMGPSGSGKSTLMHILGCLDRPTSGKYWLDDVPVDGLGDQELSRMRNRTVGFIFQSFNLIPQLSVLENIEVPLIYMEIEKSIRQKRCMEVLESVGLPHRGKHHPNELSGGENQRAAIARALVTGPEIILADEPTGNLDSKTGREIMEILQSLNQGGTNTTVVLVTHDTSIAKWANRVIQMRDGQILNDINGKEEVSAFANDQLEQVALDVGKLGVERQIIR